MSSKRKAAAHAAAASEVNTPPASKKRKISVPEQETSESTTTTGLALVNQLKNSRDKQGWSITTHFLTLPDPKTSPDYYDRIGLPIALETIEAKLNNKEYPDMTTLEGDFRRMISNAKSYNEKRSQVFSDSEKIRKILSRYMEEHNSAYRTPNYQAYTTPVPPNWKEKLEEQKAANGQDAEAEGDNDPQVVENPKSSGRQTRLITHVGSSLAADTRRASSTPAVQEAEGAFQSFEGNTFQEAQEKIMTELISYKEKSHPEPVFAPFINLPSRSIVEYYKVIKHPVSLKSVQKAVRGIKGREKPTGATFLKSWAAFEEAVSHIWENARTFNEDGSEYSELAGELEESFHRRLTEAKHVVQEPPQPRVKLRMPAKSPEPSKIKLKFGGQKSTSTPAMSVDNEALKRQQDLVRAGANGHATTTGTLPALAAPLNGGSGSASQLPNGLKAESSHGQSPALSSIQMNGAIEAGQSPGLGSTNMPPPMNASARVLSGSPNAQPYVNGASATDASSSTPFNTRVRQKGKGLSDALITNLNIRSHDGLNIKDHFNLDIPASPSRTQQSITITIPHTHYYLSITPTFSTSLLHRPSKTIVNCNNQSDSRLQPIPQKGEPDLRRPVYETRVHPGVNAIDVEVIAGPPRGAPKVGSGQEIDFEKFTVYVNLRKI
ncbi:hypothetical protein ACLMJK_006949 [Lecanora helva]